MIGIYKITNKVNNKTYIGSSKNLDKRFYLHLLMLKNNSHHSYYLQNAFNKYGEENFIFEVIETCEQENLIEREQFYIDTLKPQYNICKIAGSTIGVVRTEQTKEKLRQANLGKKYSDEINKKKASFKGFTDEHKLKISENRKQNTNNVYLINIETGEAIFFDSVTTCAKYINVKPTRISQICLGKRKQTKGFTCVYEKDFN